VRHEQIEDADPISCPAPEAMRTGTRILFVSALIALWGTPASLAARRGGPVARGEGAIWSLVLQLPANRAVRAESGRSILRGSAESVIARLQRRGVGFRSLRRLEVGTVSIESPRFRGVTVAGNLLVVTVALPPGRKARAVATNRLPVSEHPGHVRAVNLQLVAEGDMWVRSPFAIVDEPGRTAVLFQ
jgi:hypothetical protein